MRRLPLCFALLAAILTFSPSVAICATVDGLTLHSTIAGNGRKTIILVHGWTCDDTSWREQVPSLAATFRVVTLDLPGHGQSDSPKDGKFSMGLFARPEALKARENMIRGMFTPATPPALQQHVLKMMLAASAATASGAMLATFEAANSKHDVLRVPVLGVYAEKSQLANPDYARTIFSAFDYVEIPGTGHFLMMEKPHEFNQLLSTFVNKISY